MNGRVPCRSLQCMGITDCYECDIQDKCVSCITKNNVIINNGATCATGPCSNGTYPSFRYFRETHICKDCPQDCLVCTDQLNCSQCRVGTQNFGNGFCKRISFPLKYSIQNSSTNQDLKNHTAILDINITLGDDTQLEYDYLKTYATTQGYRLFSFQPEDAITDAQYTLINNSTIRISLKISKKYSNAKLKLTVSRDEVKQTEQIQLESEVKQVELYVPASFKEEELNRVYRWGITVSQVS